VTLKEEPKGYIEIVYTPLSDKTKTIIIMFLLVVIAGIIIWQEI